MGLRGTLHKRDEIEADGEYWGCVRERLHGALLLLLGWTTTFMTILELSLLLSSGVMVGFAKCHWRA